jgi:(R,R)-butanediol dehydrogenase/meso-butanediol dehydrogenase/diacetyl reductase
MRALRWHDRGDIRIEDIAEPTVGSAEVKVKVKWCGICGSDVTEYIGGPVVIPTTRPHRITGKQAPLVMGHEFSGQVVEVGSGVTSVSPGDRITVCPNLHCRQCYWCKKGEISRCASGAVVGLHADGGFAEYVIVPDYTIFKFPSAISCEKAAMCEPTAVAVHSCRRAGLQREDTAIIIGTGPIGLLILQVALQYGVSKVFAIGSRPWRNEIAKGLGATDVFEEGQIDDYRSLRRVINADAGPTKIFLCAGTPLAAQNAMQLCNRGNKIVLTGVVHQPVELFLDRLVGLESDILACLNYSLSDYVEAITMLEEGTVDCEPLITRKTSLEEAVDQGFKELVEKTGKQLKILVSPEA